MTKDDVLKLAREKFLLPNDKRNDGIYADSLLDFATAIRNAALEEAAGICDRKNSGYAIQFYAVSECAAAIRGARGK